MCSGFGTEARKSRPAVIVSNDGANATATRLGRGVERALQVVGHHAVDDPGRGQDHDRSSTDGTRRQGQCQDAHQGKERRRDGPATFDMVTHR